MNKPAIRSILVIHREIEQLQNILEQHLADVAVYYASSAQQITQCLEQHQPEAVFALNSRYFDNDSIRNAAHYPSVKWFHVAGSGIDHIMPWQAQDTMLSNGAGVLARYLAETVLGAMLAMNNNLHLYKTQQLSNTWQQHGFTPLCEQTLLIVGLGAIGEKVADNAKALGMKVMATRRKDTPYKNVDELYNDKQLADVIGQADIVTLHIPYSEENHDLFDQQMLLKMKKGACLINTARGGLVNEQALHHALTSGHLKAAFADVFKTEPLVEDSPLWQLENLFISPHMADSVHGFEQKYFQFFVNNVKLYNAGKDIKNQLK
jgi:phosphoglycerate dehydrogenase-like enzyme